MPDEAYLKIFHWHFAKLCKKNGRTQKRYHQFIFPIGNAPREDRTSIVPAILSDLMIIFGILFPYIAIFLMTGFKVPDGFKWHVIFFLLWLTLGELSPFPVAATWELLHSYISQLGRKKYMRALSAGFVWTAFLTPAAVLGFVLVGCRQKFSELAADDRTGTKKLACGRCNLSP